MDDLILKELLARKIDENYAELGVEVLGQPTLPPPLEQLIAAGKLWVLRNRGALQKVICASDKIKNLNNSDTSIQRRIQLVSAVADLILSILVDVSPFTVAVILVQEGIGTLCKDFDSD